MKTLLKIITLLLVLTACDTMTVDYRIGHCMEHNWAYKDIYMVHKRDGLKIFMKNMSGGEDITVSAIDKGWHDVDCPSTKKNK